MNSKREEKQITAKTKQSMNKKSCKFQQFFIEEKKTKIHKLPSVEDQNSSNNRKIPTHRLNMTLTKTVDQTTILFGDRAK